MPGEDRTDKGWAELSGRRSGGLLKKLYPFRNVFTLIVALYLVLATGVATAAVHVMHGRSGLDMSLGFSPSNAAPMTASTPKYLVLFVLDGARPDYFGLTKLPHVDSLIEHGTQFTSAFDGILEAETPAGHTTIATGSKPSRDGILGFNWEQNDEGYSIFNPDVVRAGAMTDIMESRGVPTIAGLYKARFPGAKVVALSGSKYYAADPLGGPDADAILYYHGDAKGRFIPDSMPGHVPPAAVLKAPGLIWPTTVHLPLGLEDNLATKMGLSAIHVMHPRILLINYPEFDWPLGHVDGGNVDPSGAKILMKTFDKNLAAIEKVYRKEGILSKTLFVITADHGMKPVARFIPQTVITNAITQAGTSSPTTAYDTACYVWLQDSTKAQAVADDIWNTKDPGVASVYYLNAQLHYQLAGGSFVTPEVDTANHYLLNSLINGHEPNVVAFSKNGNTFSNSTTNWKGDHGGAEWASEHMPLIISGPGIQQDVVTAQPAQLEDIAPTVLDDMGVTPSGMQGHVLTDALIKSSVQDQHIRAREARKLSPMIGALIAQQDYEQANGS
ncbi:MAG: alkaline phosphatase family protein [Chloroflexota bacterium]